MKIKTHRPKTLADVLKASRGSPSLLGWPGYRTQPSKSGLGYLESAAEEAHMEGLFLRWLFTGKFRTRNPIYLLSLTAFGMLTGGIPIILTIIALASIGNLFSLFPLVISAPYSLVGIAILVNVFLSVFTPNGKSITGD
jgi:NADH:ubiquinone oxidoreductase subunit K